MERIEKFLERRPVKNRRKVKSQGKEFVITKEDVKLIRSYRRNACMDPDVDLYRPLNLSFSRKTMNEGIEIRKRVAPPRTAERSRRKRWSARKETAKEENKNEIGDVWEGEGLDDLNSYEQDMLVKVEEEYSGPVELLRYGREDLERSMRRMYLRLYEPRDGKDYRLKDLIRELPKAETLRPFPEEIGLLFKFEESIRVGISQDFRIAGVGEGRKMGVYELRGFVKLRHVLFDSEIRKIMFTRGGSICVLLASNAVCVVDDVFGEEYPAQEPFFRREFPMWSREDLDQGSRSCVCTVIKADKKMNDMEAHRDGRYISVVCGKRIVVYDLKKRSVLEALRLKGTTPLRAKFQGSSHTMVISTANSLIIYDFSSRRVMKEAKEFSFILDFFSISDDKIVLLNNLNKIIVYDCSRNVVQRTMLQEDVGTEVVQHGRLNLMCVAYPTEMVIFYNNVDTDLVVPVKRIPGRYRNILFHPQLPWLYAANGSELRVFT
ncbi:hypothetical protein M970_021030 [Encephalitozoon cuniculi EcunIII-L]|nr:hypothetical protein M970_021030 [Encephalitozoon cuniculi EcunIII-L]UYI28300.1 WD40 domain-containing protein [Encephalitozoon cuniculi]